MMVDSRDNVWLFWPTILANSWESCLTNFAVTNQYDAEGRPKWDRRGLILLKPDDFGPEANALLDRHLQDNPQRAARFDADELKQWRERLNIKLYQRLGWQKKTTSCRPYRPYRPCHHHQGALPAWLIYPQVFPPPWPPW